MRVFYDCEFVERGRELPIQLVSIGMVREDGHEMYVINQECLSNVVRHPWLSINVVPELPIRFDDPYIFEWDKDHEDYPNVMAMDAIAQAVLDFLTRRTFSILDEKSLELDPAELWAWYGAYDHVVLCQTFGSMAELPPGVPMFTHELQQLAEEHPQVVLPPQPIRRHNAMHDARWVQEAFRRIDGVRNVRTISNEIEAEVIDD
jgi:hypothetical protein